MDYGEAEREMLPQGQTGCRCGHSVVGGSEVEVLRKAFTEEELGLEGLWDHGLW